MHNDKLVAGASLQPVSILIDPFLSLEHSWHVSACTLQGVFHDLAGIDPGSI